MSNPKPPLTTPEGGAKTDWKEILDDEERELAKQLRQSTQTQPAGDNVVRLFNPQTKRYEDFVISAGKTTGGKNVTLPPPLTTDQSGGQQPKKDKEEKSTQGGSGGTGSGSGGGGGTGGTGGGGGNPNSGGGGGQNPSGGGGGDPENPPGGGSNEVAFENFKGKAGRSLRKMTKYDQAKIQRFNFSGEDGLANGIEATPFDPDTWSNFCEIEWQRSWCLQQETNLNNYLDQKVSLITFFGFDPFKLYTTHAIKIKKHVRDIAFLACVLTTRGTKREKFSLSMSVEGKELISRVTDIFNLVWGGPTATNKATALTPSRLILLTPTISCMAMINVKEGINITLPFPFRCPAVASLIPDGFKFLAEAAKMASFNVTNTVTNGKDKRKSAINATQFVDAGITSGFVDNQQRWSFWKDVKNLLARKNQNWKEFCDSIEKCCVEFQTIRTTYDLPAVPYMNIFDKMESGLAEFC